MTHYTTLCRFSILYHLYIHNVFTWTTICPVYGTNLIQPTLFAYPYHLVFLILYCFKHTNVSAIVLNLRGEGLLRTLHRTRGSYYDFTMITIVSLPGNTQGFETNAQTTRNHDDRRSSIDYTCVWFQCDFLHFLWNTSISVIGRNFGMGTVPGVVLKKCSGLWLSDTLWWLIGQGARQSKPYTYWAWVLS